MLIRNRKVLLALLVVGLFVVEAFFSLWTGNNYDMNIWFQTGAQMSRGINIYVTDNHIGYPPLWAIWCTVSYGIYGLFGNSLEIWRFAIKLPMILAHLALSFIVWKFAQKQFDPKRAKKIFLITLTSVFFIYIGAFWGQINALSALLTFLAFYAVISKRVTAGALFLGVAVALKIYPVIVLPVFLAYIFRNFNLKETGKFLLYNCLVPVVSTLAVFAAFNWDILYFLKTIFYWAPIYDANPIQLQGGCMNFWSFLGLCGVEISMNWILRFIWIPILGAAAIYWFRKKILIDADLNLAIISFYLLFMISYSWITEQMFIDPLPFIFLQIVGYRPKRSYLYALVVIQVLIFAFSATNWGPFIFEPFLRRFSPALFASIQPLDPSKNAFVWEVRGVLGLAVSVALGLFLFALAKPTFWIQTKKLLSKTFSRFK